MEQIPIAASEFACGASLAALGPIMLSNAGLLSGLMRQTVRDLLADALALGLRDRWVTGSPTV